MPIYEFKCLQCDESFEELIRCRLDQTAPPRFNVPVAALSKRNAYPRPSVVRRKGAASHQALPHPAEAVAPAALATHATTKAALS